MPCFSRARSLQAARRLGGHLSLRVPTDKPGLPLRRSRHPARRRGGPPGPASASPPRRYSLLLRRSRLMAVAFWAATSYFLFWAIPWFPGGLSEKDYTGRVALTVILGGLCAVLGVGTLVLRGHLRRTREALLAWTTVYDDTTGLYNRRYFYDRLSLGSGRA